MTLDSAYQSAVGRIPNWVGFVFIILASATAIVVGAVVHNHASGGFIAFGIWGIISAILAWISGAKSSPQLNPFTGSFGGTVREIPAVTWLIIAVLFVIAGLVAYFTW